jgi:hypothetical protein
MARQVIYGTGSIDKTNHCNRSTIQGKSLCIVAKYARQVIIMVAKASQLNSTKGKTSF